jgi:uncharacterized protein YbjT (DUF2867 family)
MIAVDDIGAYGALAFTRADALDKQELDIAGDARTMPETAAVLSEALGRKIEFMRIPIEAVRQNSDDFARMLEWFDRVGYSADIAGNEKRFGIRPTRLEEWAKTQRA